MSILCETQSQLSRHKLPPVFNKRLYKAQAGIVLTDKILGILQRPIAVRRMSEELVAIKPVVAALKEIHKGLQFIKEALSFAMTYERVEADVEINKKVGEKCLSCYYILNGSVEAKYEINNGVFGSHNERSPVDNSKDCEISYTHVAGEYLGLVSGDGPEFDYPPPDKIKTIEVSEFLRVDREQFHKAVRQVQNRCIKEIEDFIEGVAAFRTLPREDKSRLVTLMARQEYPAGTVIVNQGDRPEHLFFVAKGRCQYYRSIFIEEINREEMVELGQIEKGEFFGESSFLDSSQCFCSVASIGSVTCFLVSTWAIKTNENIIRILRENKRHFFTDDDIKHYIRDSDVWQSFKRCTITDLLKIKGKCFATIDRGEMASALSRALEYGDAKRLSLKLTNRYDELPGAPKRVEKLFVAPRSSRRRSSAILNCNAAAVVKAVLLLRRNSDAENDNSPGLTFPTGRFSSFQSCKQVKADEMFPHRPRVESGRKSRCKGKEKMKTLPIFRRTESIEIQTTRGTLSRPKSEDSSCGNSRRRSPNDRRKGSKVDDADPTRKQGNKIPKTRKKMNCMVDLKGPSIHEWPNGPLREATFNMNSMDSSSRFLPSAAMERSVVQKPNVVIKEIINTGIPGRRLSPKSYRRFERSVFDVMDQESNSEASSSDEDNAKSPVLNPWNVSFASSKWLANVRMRRRNTSDQDGNDDAGQPPIIVIEDWSPGTENSSAEAMDPTDASPLVASRMAPLKKMSRTTTPVLDNVAEESEEEIQRYEEDLVPSERWRTSIHEARDTCKQQLIEFKKEIETLEEQRKNYKYQTLGNQTTDKNEDNSEKKAEQSDVMETCTEKNVPGKDGCKTMTEESNHLRRSSLNVSRGRSTTFSDVGNQISVEKVVDNQRLRRTQSLSRFRLISLSAPNKISRSPASIMSDHKSNMSQDQDHTEKTDIAMQTMRIQSSRIEKRRLLLRKKIEELDKNAQ